MAKNTTANITTVLIATVKSIIEQVPRKSTYHMQWQFMSGLSPSLIFMVMASTAPPFNSDIFVCKKTILVFASKTSIVAVNSLNE